MNLLGNSKTRGPRDWYVDLSLYPDPADLPLRALIFSKNNRLQSLTLPFLPRQNNEKQKPNRFTGGSFAKGEWE